MAREARRSLSATRVVGLKMRRCDDEFIDVCRRERALKQSPRGTRGEALGIFPYRGGRTRREFRLALSRDDDLLSLPKIIVDSTLLNRIIHF